MVGRPSEPEDDGAPVRSAPAWITVGRVGRPHGLDGSFHVARPRPELLRRGTRVHVVATAAGGGDRAAASRSDRAAASAAGAAGPPSAAPAREREIVRRAGTDERPIVRLAGCEDRAAAEALRGGELRVPAADAPPLEEGEYWAHELVGCRVRDGATEVGVVRELLALPSCEVLEVEREGGGTLLVPLVSDAVRSVDPQARAIEVSLAFLEGGA